MFTKTLFSLNNDFSMLKWDKEEKGSNKHYKGTNIYLYRSNAHSLKFLKVKNAVIGK